MNPWTLELLVVRHGVSDTERRALARDCERGLLLRVRPGVYVERTGFEDLTPEQQHVVQVRAHAAVAAAPPTFSHWSAAVLLGLPVLRGRLGRVHLAVADVSGRSIAGVAAHLVSVRPDEVVAVGGMRATGIARTVVDVSLAAPFEEGVIAADGALRSGLRRDVLHGAVEDAAGRRGARRAQDAVAFARPEAESAAESRSRVSHLRIGIRPPVLQLEVVDRLGVAGRLDFGYPWVRSGGEVDGEQKYLKLAKHGAARAVIDEKWREDRLRRQLDSLARWGWIEAGTPALLASILASAGVLPETPRATLADYCSSFLAERFRPART